MSGPWVIAAASVAGTSHLASGKSCEDYHLVEVVPAKDGQTALIAAVADGAGSAPLGAEGARIVCETWLDRMKAYVANTLRFQSDAGFGRVVQAKAALNLHAAQAKRELGDYACTFLGACVLPRRTLVVQVGDGAIVLRGADMQFKPAFWPEQGEYANATAFVTDDDAATRTCSWVYSYPIVELAIFSDGLQRLALDYESKSAFQPFFASMFSHMRGPADDLSGSLAAFLNSGAVNDRTDDDKTLVLARREAGIAS